MIAYSKTLQWLLLVFFSSGLIVLTGGYVHAQTEPESKEQSITAGTLPELPPFAIPYDPNLPTKRVLVSSFDVAVPGLPSGLQAEKGLKAQLSTVLSKSKNFMIIDRDALSDLRDELVLKKARAVTRESSAKAGKLLGAQVVVKGVITEFTESAKGKSAGIKFSAGEAAEVAGIFKESDTIDAVIVADPEIKYGKETVTGVVGLDIRIIDINTGTVLKSFDARGEITRKNTQRSLGVAGLTAVSKDFEKTVIGQATRLAMRDAVTQIFEGMRRVPWTGLVAAVKPDGTIIINAGSDHNLRVGQEMYIEAEVATITDPATGLVLYEDRTKTAEISLFSVQDNVSFGRIISGGSDIQRGDVVTLK